MKLFSSELNPFIIGFISQESNLSKNKLFLQLIEDMFILIKTPVSPHLFFRDNYNWPFLPASDVKVK